MTETRTALCRLDSAWTRTDEGYLDAAVYPTKAGVFLYLNKDGSTRRELRPRSEVHDAASLKTLENKPHTNSHPPVLLNSKNTKQYQTGNVYGKHEVAEDGIHTKARVMVTDEATINDIQSGKEQVSCGYTCDIDNTSGIDPEFGAYDAIQRNIKYNHLASEWRGRAGAGAAIKRDSDDDGVRFDAYEIESDTQIINKIEGLPKMGKIRIDGHEFEADKALEIAYENQVKADAQALKDAQAIADQEKARADKLEAERDTLKAELENAQKLDVDALVQARASLIAEASKHLKDAKFDGQSDRQIKEQVIKARLDWATVENRSDDYINGLYESAIKAVKNDVASALDGAISKTDGVDTVEAIRQKQIKELSGVN